MVVALCVLRAAYAGPPTEAQRLYAEAARLFAQKKFVDAGRKFEAVFAVNPDHAYLYNAAIAYERGGELGDAVRLLDKFAVYSSNAARVQAAREKVRVLAAELAKTRALLKIDVEPSGAFVLLDGDPKPIEAPLERWMLAGEHTIDIRKAGYESHVARVTLIAGERKPVRITLAEVRQFGAVEVVTTPAGARVTLDGEHRGTAPLSLPRVAVGRHLLRAELDGHEPVTREIAVEPNGDTRLAVQLDRLVAPAPIDVPTAPIVVSSPSIATRWWFWTAIGVAVAGGVVATVLLLPDREPATAPAGQPWVIDGTR